MSRIILENITKKFGDTVAVNNLSLEIEEGEFFCMLGPSGCGKTTLLRCIAGLEIPDCGRIWIGNKLVFDAAKNIFVPASRRNLGLVFQDYALWPHMTVRENILFGLQIRKVKPDEQKKRLEEIMKLLQIVGLDKRYPNELSGGQQQRVSLARELITGANLLLLDEPLSNLDAQLRIGMRFELKRIHEETNHTFLYVTHDQIEALTLSSKTCILRDGQLQQLANPNEIYKSPQNLFVARFIGGSSMAINLLMARIEGEQLIGDGFSLTFPYLKDLENSREVILAIRPEEIQVVVDECIDPLCLPCVVSSELLMGHETLLQLELRGQKKSKIMAFYNGQTHISIKMHVWARIPKNAVHVFDSTTGLRLGTIREEKNTAGQSKKGK